MKSDRCLANYERVVGEGEGVGLSIRAGDGERAVGLSDGELRGRGAALGPEDGVDGELGGGLVALQGGMLLRDPFAGEVGAADRAGDVFRIDGNGERVGHCRAPGYAGRDDPRGERGFFLRADDGRGAGGGVPREVALGVSEPREFVGGLEDDAVAEDDVAGVDENEVAGDALDEACFLLACMVGDGSGAAGPYGARGFFVARDFAGGGFALGFLAETVDQQGIFGNRLAGPVAAVGRVVEFAVCGVDREAFAVGV